MITILSQDQTKLLKAKRIIIVEQPNHKWAVCNLEDGSLENLGEYFTKEYAVEIIQEIVEAVKYDDKFYEMPRCSDSNAYDIRTLEELGYTKYDDSSYVVYVSTVKPDYEGERVHKRIDFDLAKKEVEIYLWWLDGCDGKKESCNADVEELMAIHQVMRELGWIEQ